MNDFLVGIYKEVGKNPDIIKIRNKKEYLEKLLDGEYTKQDYDNYTILYKKDSDNLLANIYVEQYSKLGISLKGKVFAVGKDEKGNFISLNQKQAKKCITFFLREAFNYKNFDEYGRYLPKSARRNNRKIFNNIKNKEKTIQQEQVIQNNSPTTISTNDMSKALNIGNNFFENHFRLEKYESNKQVQNSFNSTGNAKQQCSIDDSHTPIIKLSDEQTLNMILKITFTILDFVKEALEDSETDEQ